MEPHCGEALCRLFPPDDNIDLRTIAMKAKRAHRQKEREHFYEMHGGQTSSTGGGSGSGGGGSGGGGSSTMGSSNSSGGGAMSGGGGHTAAPSDASSSRLGPVLSLGLSHCSFVAGLLWFVKEKCVGELMHSSSLSQPDGTDIIPAG